MSTLVSFLFEDEFSAFEMRVALLKVQKEYQISLEDSVVVTRDQKGKIKLDQAVSLTRRGASEGGFWEMLLGLIFPNPQDAAIGGATGTVSARFADTRVTDGVTKDLAQSFKPGSSALFILVRRATVDTVLEGLKNFVGKARVFQTSLTQQQETTLQQALEAAGMREAALQVGASADGVSSLRAPRLHRRILRDALFPLLRTAWREYEHDYARYYAVAVVYYAFVSLVPLLLLVLATLGLILQYSDVAATAARNLLSSAEASLGTEVSSYIEQAFQRLRRDSLITTTASLVGLLIVAAALFKQLRLTFRALWKQAPPLVAGSVWRTIGDLFREGVIAFLMVLAGGVLLLVAFGLLTVVQWASALVSRVPLLGGHAGWLLTLAPTFLIAPASFALLFRFLPPQRLRWRDVALASILCGAAWLLGVELLSLYGRYVSDHPSAYGTLGGVLIVMLWMNVVSQMLFFGAEICKTVFWSRTDEPIAVQ